MSREFDSLLVEKIPYADSDDQVVKRELPSLLPVQFDTIPITLPTLHIPNVAQPIGHLRLPAVRYASSERAESRWRTTKHNQRTTKQARPRRHGRD